MADPNAKNVQGDYQYEPDKEGLGGLWQQVTGRSNTRGPNAGAYGKAAGLANENAAGLYGQAQGYNQATPQIYNQFQGEDRGNIQGNIANQNYLAGQLGDIISGKDVTGSKALIGQGTDAAIQAQMAMARSAHGGAAGQAGAQRQAQQQAGILGAGVANQAAMNQAQMAAQAAQAQAGIYGQVGSERQAQYMAEQEQAIRQAELQGASQAQINQMRLGLYGLSAQQQGLSMGALQNYTTADLATQGIQMGQSEASGKTAQTLIGTGAGIVGAMYGGPAGAAAGSAAGNAISSDIHAKQAAHDEGYARGLNAAGSGRTTVGQFQQGQMGAPQQTPYMPSQGPMGGLGAPDQGPQGGVYSAPVPSPVSAQQGPAAYTPQPPAQVQGPLASLGAPAVSQTSFVPSQAPQASQVAMPRPEVTKAPQALGQSFMSDERAKTGMERESLADAFMDNLHPYSYSYKDPSNEPNEMGEKGGRYLGVMAQDVEKTPEIGHQIVQNTPTGKKLSTGASLSAALAGIARLNERLKQVEGSR